MSTVTNPVSTGFAPSHPAPFAHPRRMAAIAAILGVDPPEVAGATVVELGCADAANLLSIAAADPSLTAIGVDPSAAAIERARTVAEAAGLTGATLTEGAAAQADDGTADFVIASDVLSRVDAEARAAVLAEAARVARPGGLVMLSYDAIPGAVGRLFSRSIGRRAAAAEIEAGDAEGARVAAVSALRAAARNGAAGPDFVALATSEAERLAQLSADRVLHHELAEHWEPLTVSELATQAAAQGLAYLGELTPADRWRERFAEAEVRRIVGLAGKPSPALQQQVVDDMLGPASHASLFVRGAAPKEPIGGGARRPAGPAAAEWHVTIEHAGDWPELPIHLTAVGSQVRGAGPAGLSIAEITERTGVLADTARQAASTLDAAGLVRLSLSPPAGAMAPGDQPHLSALALAQLRLGQSMLTSLRHREVSVGDPRMRELLLLVDGTRDRAAIRAALEASTTEGVAELASSVDDLLEQFAAAGLLTA